MSTIDGGTKSHMIRMLCMLPRMLHLLRHPPQTVLLSESSVPGPRRAVLPVAIATQALGEPMAIPSALGSTVLLPHVTDLPLPEVCPQRF